ncbi:serine hydrolase domain-containing protein [Anaerosporobacter faecicola]|uniref:serine hydrolase domain-containing protein n=1 Tax=Anaerosporobacter faecicola TaxID=2718714 RepID=UPI00143B1222|nr:serine hydrolase domain-containing protein [Anaerosporobacter faecicola]
MNHKIMFQTKGLRNLAKRTLSLSLVCVLSISPSFLAQAKQTTDGTLAIEATAQSEDRQSTWDFEATAKSAAAKAKQLTSLYGNTSVQYALIHNGEIVVSGHSGYANREKKKAPTKDSIYGIGSISKIFTTVAILQLVEDGVLELDAPVVNYIPDFKMADERYKQITVRMLINHSSGLMGNLINNTLLFYDPDSTNTDHILEYLSTQRLKADPGSFSVYSNDGFTLAELLIERVSKSTFTDYIYEHISKPIGLTNTKTPQSGFSRQQMAKTYYDVDALPADYSNFIGAGGLYSTAEDLCHFLDIFMTKNDVLSEESVTAMEQPEYLRGLWGNDGDNVLNYGLGWDSIKLYPFNKYGIQALSKGGDTYTYHGNVVMIPEYDLGVAVLSSSGSSSLDQLMCNSILMNCLQENNVITELIEEPEATKPVTVTMPESYKNYSGYYANVQEAFNIIFTDSNSFKMCYSEDTTSGTEFFYVGNGIFKDATGTTEMTFKKLSNQKTYLNLKTIASIPGFPAIAQDILYAQKLEDNPVSDSVKNAWKNRDGKKYYALSEKYTSQLYLSELSQTFYYDTLKEGYFINFTMVNEDTLEQRLEIPMNYGRDLTDIKMYRENNTEYMKVNSALYVSADAVKNLSSKKSFKVTIADTGYATWYKIPSSLADKKIKVTIPDHAGYAVYDSQGMLVFLSTISANQTVTLPEGGSIVFAGDAGVTFQVNYK